MPLKGAYFNGGLNVSQFHYDSSRLEIITILHRASQLPDCAERRPPCSSPPYSVNNASGTTELSMNFDQF